MELMTRTELCCCFAGLMAFNRFVLITFLLEMVVRFVASYPDFLSFFKDGWNLLDIACVTAGVFGMIVAASGELNSRLQ